MKDLKSNSVDNNHLKYRTLYQTKQKMKIVQYEDIVIDEF